VVGYTTIDSLDTIMLRGLVPELLFHHPGDIPYTDAIYFPTGYPLLHLVPNLLDHMVGGALDMGFGFPLGDNLFWLLLIAGNGLAAHRLGFQLGRTHSAALLVGVAYAASENLLREVNLHHAPQALSPWAPLYLAAILRATEDRGQKRDVLSAALWMALSGITYWYTALFLAIGTAPLLWIRRQQWRRFAQAAGLSALLAAPFLLPYALHLGDLPLASLSQHPSPSNSSAALDLLPPGQAFITEHGNDLALPFRATPLDTSNRISLVLLLAVGLSIRRGGRKIFLAVAAIGALFALGPYLRWGSEPLFLGDTPIALPFRWLSAASPIFERLTWPERWGILIALGLAASAARAPRPKLLAAFLVLETLLLSGNAPVQTSDLAPMAGWSRLQAADGAILELPLARNHQQAPYVGLHARIHGKKVVNPILQPPDSLTPSAWKDWKSNQPLIGLLPAIAAGEAFQGSPQVANRLREDGIAAVALDAAPGVLTPARVNRWAEALTTLFGAPEDQGSVLIWWLKPPIVDEAPALHFRGRPIQNGVQWRKALQIYQERHPPPDLDTLIEAL
jgi:hypothetical protein